MALVVPGCSPGSSPSGQTPGTVQRGDRARQDPPVPQRAQVLRRDRGGVDVGERLVQFAQGEDAETDRAEGQRDERAVDVAGIAVHTAARVAAEAEAGETVVSSTVRDLVAGSGLNFQDRGIHELKGLPEALHLYSVLQVR